MLVASKNLSLAALLFFVLPVRGDVTGTVTLKGKPPAIPSITPRFDTEVCGREPRPLRVLKFGTNQTVSGAIIYLSTPATAGATAEVATLEMSDCRLSPRIRVVKGISAVMLKNHDPMLHMVRLDLLSGTNAPRNVAIEAAPYAGYEKRIAVPPLKEPALLRMSGMNGHEWLTAYIAVLPFQWVTLSDTNGAFKIPGVRPGAYTVYAWHEALGTLACELKVGSNRTANVNLEFTSIPPQHK